MQSMTQEQLRLLQQEGEALNRHLMSVHMALRQTRVTQSRGPATVTLTGLGELLSIEVEGVDEETLDCVVAAFLAAQQDAQRSYERYGQPSA